MIVQLNDHDGRGRSLVDVQVATTDRTRTKGLSGRSSIGDGMLFIFPRDTFVPFTVAKMLVPIDIAWADSQGRVLGIARNLVPGSRWLARSTASAYRYALEVPGGWMSQIEVRPGWRMAW